METTERTRAKKDFKENLENKKVKYSELSEKNIEKSNDLCNESMNMISNIPMGQPILIGHHSEKGHRSLLKRSDNKMGKSIEASDKAKYYEKKAKRVGTGGIMTDDPEALIKLDKKLEVLEAKRALIKEFRALAKTTNRENAITQLDSKFSKNDREQLAVGFGYYFDMCHQTNITKNIRTLKKRIEAIKKMDAIELIDFRIGDIHVLEDEGRINIFFDDKPSDENRARLKQSGVAFKWSPSRGCWTRKKTQNTGEFFLNNLKNILESF